jgi:hypothetical protein
LPAVVAFAVGIGALDLGVEITRERARVPGASFGPEAVAATLSLS